MQSRLTIKFILLAIILALPANTWAVIYGYIPNSADNTVSVINTADDTDISSINPLGTNPFGVAASPTGDYVYVSNRESNSVAKIDRQTGTVVTTYFVNTNPVGVAVSPDGTEVYVACQAGYLSVIDTTDNSITQILVGTSLFGVAVNPDSESIYVTDDTDNRLRIIRQSDLEIIASLEVGSAPKGIAVSPSGTKIVVVNSGANTVSVITAATNEVSAPITVENNPFGVAITNDGIYAYVTNTGNDSISKISLNDHSVVHVPLDPDSGPQGIAISPYGDQVFVVNNTANAVKAINTADDDITSATTFAVETSPVGFGKFFFPDTPSNLTATLVGKNGIDLSWNDNTDSEDGFTLERRKYINGSFFVVDDTLETNTTSYSDRDLGHNANYYYRVKAHNDAGSTLYSNIDFAQTEREDISCFIATAAHGSYWEPQVMILREFRDSFLMPNRVGKLLVKCYYRLSPPAANFIARHDNLRFAARISLVPLIGFSWLTLHYGIAISLALATGLIIAFFFTDKRLGDHTRKPL